MYLDDDETFEEFMKANGYEVGNEKSENAKQVVRVARNACDRQQQKMALIEMRIAKFKAAFESL